MDQKFVYYMPVEGRAVPRYGTSAFVGARVTKDGFVWGTDPVPIPVQEFNRYGKEYRHHEAMGDLVRVETPAAALDAPPLEGAVQDEPTAERGRRRTRR